MEGISNQAVDPKMEVPDGGEAAAGEASQSAEDSEAFLCAQKCVFCNCIMTLKDDSKLLECLHPSCDLCVRPPNDTSDIDLGEPPRYITKTCPECNHTTTPDKLIDNKFLVEITAQEANRETKCKNCVDQLANDWCNECTNYICEACVTEHRNSRLCKHHTIVSKEEMFLKKESNPIIDSYFKCSVHPKEVQEVYCNTCGEILCRDCTLVNHKGHSYGYVNEIAMATRTELTSLVAKLRYRTDMARDGMRQVDLKNKAIQEKRIELHDTVRDTVKELVSTLKTMSDNLMAEIDVECERRRQINCTKGKALSQAYAQGHYSTEFVIQALEMATDKCLAYSRQRILDHVNRQLTAKNVSFPAPDYPINMHLKKNSIEKLRQVLSTFVRLETSDASSQQYMVHVAPQIVNQQTFYQHSQQYQQQQQMQKQQQQMWYMQQQQQQHQQQQQQQLPQGICVAGGSGYGGQQQGHGSGSVVHHQPSQVHVSQQAHVIQGSASGPLRSPQQQVTSSTDQQATSPLHARTHPQHQTMGFGGLGKAVPHHQQFYQHQQQQNYHQTPQQQQVAATAAPNLKNLLTTQQQPSAHHQQLSRLKPTVGLQGMTRVGMMGRTQASGAARLVQAGVQQQQQQQQQQQHQQAQQLHQQAQAAWLHHQQQQLIPAAPAQPVNSAPTWHIPQLEPSSGGSRQPAQNQAASCGSVTPNTARQDNFKIHLPSRTVEQTKQLTSVAPSLPPAPAPIAEDLDFSSAGVLDLLQNLATDEISRGTPTAGTATKESVGTTSTKDITLGDKTVTSTAATPPAAVPAATPPVLEQPASSTIQEGVVEWQKDDPNEDWCAVCMDGGDLVCCDSCPKVFHTTCHIPHLAQTPPQDEPWQCLLCRTLPCLSGIGERRGQDLTLTQHTILERILLELYCQYDQSLHFREPVPPDNKEYHNIIKKPMSFDMIRRRLAADSYNPYKSVRQVIRHIRQVFKNAFLFNEVGSQVCKDAMNLEEFLECLLTKYLPDFAHTDLSDSSSEDEDEPQVKRFRRIVAGSET